ncbi:hypothetical protein RclHR1_18030004 [Rhizophagus clarus]|uniref:Uncharacterized protein n=1 Tax=Rhizophagus clarus TaxID=94130 RepID=A0A2Z6QLQ9_9GLOM|nr:hypothetical protein RclHR1_18030004 [Rhizophagus clarus]
MITYKDWLCRFAFELVEWILVKHNTKVMILNPNINIDDTKSGELAEDLLSIITIFTAKYSGFRSAKN